MLCKRHYCRDVAGHSDATAMHVQGFVQWEMLHLIQIGHSDATDAFAFARPGSPLHVRQLNVEVPLAADQGVLAYAILQCTTP